MAKKRKGKYVPYQRYDGKLGRCQFRWRFIAPNGRIISASTEGYNRIGACLRAIEIMQGSGDCEVCPVVQE